MALQQRQNVSISFVTISSTIKLIRIQQYCSSQTTLASSSWNRQSHIQLKCADTADVLANVISVLFLLYGDNPQDGVGELISGGEDGDLVVLVIRQLQKSTKITRNIRKREICLLFKLQHQLRLLIRVNRSRELSCKQSQLFHKCYIYLVSVLPPLNRR